MVSRCVFTAFLKFFVCFCVVFVFVSISTSIPSHPFSRIHAAMGYLPDQFLQDGVNKRADEYGGSVANRCRFVLEVVDAVASAVGAKKVAIRFSPWSIFQAMHDSDPVALFSRISSAFSPLSPCLPLLSSSRPSHHFTLLFSPSIFFFFLIQIDLLQALQEHHPQLAYVHFVEPRVVGDGRLKPLDVPEANLSHFRKAWKGIFMSAGGYTAKTAVDQIESGRSDLVALGRLFLANPDLVRRIEQDLPLNTYDRSTFYTNQEKGYVDYPFYNTLS